MIRFSSNLNTSVNSDQVSQILNDIKSDPMGGWYDLPENYDRTEFAAIKQAATEIQNSSEYLVCIGIGGSYLGHRAVVEALQPKTGVKLLYAGNSLSPVALQNLLDELGDSDFSVNVISKSGTTTEPAVAFRLFKAKLKEKYGADYTKRIYATTDAARGALHDEAVQEGYTRFVVPDNIGGRYSVLTAVGLLPLAAAGVNIDELLEGAAEERKALESSLEAQTLTTSAPVQYATTRANFHSKNSDTEILATFEPHFQMFTEWWKQLYGESEGKQHQGIFPASVVYTTDLHSLGQYLQEGRRNIFETMLEFSAKPATDSLVPALPENLDGLQYLEGKPLSELNQKALEATISAHRDGGIPVLEITAPDQSERSLGALIFFFEAACAISAKLSNVNPFDQPGVEAYKTNMFRLLGKPGYEAN